MSTARPRRFYYRPDGGTEGRHWCVYASDPAQGTWPSLGTVSQLSVRRWRGSPAEGGERVQMSSRKDVAVGLWLSASPELRQRAVGGPE